MLSLCIARTSLHRARPFASASLRNDGRARYAHAYNAKAFVPRPDGPNYLIVQHLLHEFETEAMKDDFSPYKARAFQRAIKALDQVSEVIESGSQAQKVPNIGTGISRRIEEFLNPEGQSSSQLSMSGSASQDEVVRDRILMELTKVPGIGPVKARKLLDSGCLCLEDLQKPKFQALLSTSSRAALDFVGHLEQRIPRSQVDSVVDVINSVVSSEIRMHVVGSYRRGISACADIDIIVFHPSCVYVPRPGEKPAGSKEPSRSGSRGRPSKQNRHLGKQKLDNVTLLKETVLIPLERAGITAAMLNESQRKWQGIIRVPKEDEDNLKRALGVRDRLGTFRRMDITLYPLLSEGSALLASTGDAEFNSYLRKVARTMGLRLNEYGLWRHFPSPGSSSEDSTELDRGTNGKNVGTKEGRWEFIASRTEQDIFDELGIDYVEPERRNFSFIATKQKVSKQVSKQKK